MPISKDTMKNVFKCVLDMRNDTAIICGKKIKLEDNNKAGHYMLDFLPGHIETYEDALTAMFEESYAAELVKGMEAEKPSLLEKKMTRKELMKMLTSIHSRFGHPSEEKSMALLLAAGVENTEVRSAMREVVEACTHCKKHVKPKSRSVVNFTLRSPDFNHTIAIDIAYIEDRPILKIIDLSTG